MIKDYIINKANVLIMYFVLIGLFCFIPANEKYVFEENNISSNVYLLDKDDYVSKVMYYFNTDSVIDLISEKLQLLMNGIGNDNFVPLIPKNTKINKIDVVRDNVYIDFNEEILNVNKSNEEEMIEAIVYSLCDINGINNIYLSINGKSFNVLPNSKKEIMYPLNKNFGINKDYNILNFNDISKTVVVFAKEVDDFSYFVPITKVYNSQDEKVEVIIQELKSIENTQDGLIGYLNNDVKLVNYSIGEDTMVLSFNTNIDREYENFINLSINENYKNKQIIYKYE